MLFTRRLFLAFQCGVAAVAFLTLRRYASWPAALAIALACVALLPFGLPNLSYNTLGSGLFALGLLAAAPAVVSGETGARRLAGCGLAHGLAILAFPPLLLPVLAFAAIAFPLFVGPRSRALAGYAAAGLAVGAALLAVAGIDGLTRVYDFMSIRYEPEPGKLARVSAQLLGLLPLPLALVAGAGLLAGLRRRWPVAVLVALPLLPLAVAWPLQRMPLWVASLPYVSAVGLLAPLLLPLVWRDVALRRAFAAIWLPSAVAGVTFAWASTNGYTNAGLGMLPAALVTGLYLHAALREAVANAGWRRLAPVTLVPALLVAGVLLSLQRGLYLGGSILPDPASLRRIESGPFAGIRARPQRADFLDVLARDLQRVERPGGYVLFYDHFPAGYLMTGMRPATPSLYGCFLLTQRRDAGLCARHYARTIAAPNVAVWVPPTRMLGNHLAPNAPRDEATRGVVQRRLAPVIRRIDARERELYEIFASDAS